MKLAIGQAHRSAAVWPCRALCCAGAIGLWWWLGLVRPGAVGNLPPGLLVAAGWLCLALGVAGSLLGQLWLAVGFAVLASLLTSLSPGDVVTIAPPADTGAMPPGITVYGGSPIPALLAAAALTGYVLLVRLSGMPRVFVEPVSLEGGRGSVARVWRRLWRIGRAGGPALWLSLAGVLVAAGLATGRFLSLRWWSMVTLNPAVWALLGTAIIGIGFGFAFPLARDTIGLLFPAGARHVTTLGATGRDFRSKQSLRLNAMILWLGNWQTGSVRLARRSRGRAFVGLGVAVVVFGARLVFTATRPDFLIGADAWALSIEPRLSDILSLVAAQFEGVLTGLASILASLGGIGH